MCMCVCACVCACVLNRRSNCAETTRKVVASGKKSQGGYAMRERGKKKHRRPYGTTERWRRVR